MNDVSAPAYAGYPNFHKAQKSQEYGLIIPRKEHKEEGIAKVPFYLANENCMSLDIMDRGQPAYMFRQGVTLKKEYEHLRNAAFFTELGRDLIETYFEIEK